MALRSCRRSKSSRPQRRRRRTASRPPPSAPKPGPASPSSARTRTRPFLAPGTARRRALDDALAEIEAGRREPSSEWKVQLRAHARARARARREPPHLASGTELRRHQVDALAGMLTELIAAHEKSEANGNGAATRPSEEEERARGGVRRGRARRRGGRRGASRPRSGRRPPLPLPPPDRVRQDDRRRGLRRGRAHARRPDPHAPPPARRPVPARADRRRATATASRRRSSAARSRSAGNPITIQTYAWFARHLDRSRATRTSS